MDGAPYDFIINHNEKDREKIRKHNYKQKQEIEKIVLKLIPVKIE